MRSQFYTIENNAAPHCLHVSEWGDANNPNVVICVHGLTRNARDFDKVAEQLSEHFRVLCVDVVGRGKSDRLANPAQYNYATYYGDICALYPQWQIPADAHINWLGTSMGGILGMLVAGSEAPPIPIKKLVLNDIGFFVPKAALERLVSYVGVVTDFESVDAWEQYLRDVCAGFGPMVNEHWRYIAEHSCLIGEDGLIHPAYDPNIAIPLRETIDDVDLFPFWEKVDCDVLVLRGECSDVLLRKTFDEMTALPNVQGQEFVEVGHAPMLMDDEQIKSVVDFFVGD